MSRRLRIGADMRVCKSKTRRKGKDLGAIDIRDGGNAIPYDEEDPLIRKEFEDTQRREGAVSRMEDWLYVTPKEGEARPMTDFVGM